VECVAFYPDDNKIGKSSYPYFKVDDILLYSIQNILNDFALKSLCNEITPFHTGSVYLIIGVFYSSFIIANGFYRLIMFDFSW